MPINNPDRKIRKIESRDENESLICTKFKFNVLLKSDEKRIDGSLLKAKIDTDININNKEEEEIWQNKH